MSCISILPIVGLGGASSWQGGPSLKVAETQPQWEVAVCYSPRNTGSGCSVSGKVRLPCYLAPLNDSMPSCISAGSYHCRLFPAKSLSCFTVFFKIYIAEPSLLCSTLMRFFKVTSKPSSLLVDPG